MHTPKQFSFDATKNINAGKIEQLSFDDIEPSTTITTLNAGNLISNGLEYDTKVRPVEMVAEEEVKVPISKFTYMEDTIKRQDEEIDRLKLQISRYEKLIDMIER